MEERKVKFVLSNIKYSDIEKCPFLILVPDHYRGDGTCKCDDPEYQKMMIKEWGYKRSDFKKRGELKIE